MVQQIVCYVDKCGYHGKNGFCLNKLTVINDQGVCKYLTRSGWDQKVEDWMKNTYREPKEENNNDFSNDEERV